MPQTLGEGAGAAHCDALYAHADNLQSQALQYPPVGIVDPQTVG